MLIASGTSPVALSRLIERQIRLMLLSKSLKESGHKEREISHRLSLFGYPLQKTIKMGRKIGWNRLLEFHDCVLHCHGTTLDIKNPRSGKFFSFVVQNGCDFPMGI